MAITPMLGKDTSIQAIGGGAVDGVLGRHRLRPRDHLGLLELVSVPVWLDLHPEGLAVRAGLQVVLPVILLGSVVLLVDWPVVQVLALLVELVAVFLVDSVPVLDLQADWLAALVGSVVILADLVVQAVVLPVGSVAILARSNERSELVA